MQELFQNLGIDPAVISALALAWGGRIVAALLIFIIGRWVAKRIATGVAKATERANVDPTLSKFLRSVIYMSLLVMVVLAAVQQLGVEATSFFAILGAAGLAVGLALKDSLANFSSGVMLVLFRPFKSGDFVEAAGVDPDRVAPGPALDEIGAVPGAPDDEVVAVLAEDEVVALVA